MRSRLVIVPAMAAWFLISVPLAAHHTGRDGPVGDKNFSERNCRGMALVQSPLFADA